VGGGGGGGGGGGYPLPGRCSGKVGMEGIGLSILSSIFPFP